MTNELTGSRADSPILGFPARDDEVGDIIRAAQDGGIPAESIFFAMEAAGEVGDSRPWASRVSLGNGTAVEIVLTPVPSHALSGCEGPGWVLISVIGDPWSAAYPFKREDGVLHWTYVAEKLEFGLCDASQLALWLGIVLRRQGVSGCERSHG